MCDKKICPKGKELFYLSVFAAYLRNGLKDAVFFALLEKYYGYAPECAKRFVYLGRKLARQKELSTSFIKEHYTMIKINEE